jgi:16S rRNA (uracil1498-N3)-methyltransferase
MTRFFVSPDQIHQGLATLDEGDAHHLRVVLKAQPGERVSVLDGSGREWPGALLELGKSRALVKLGEPSRPATEPRTQITVAQALPKVADKMEHVLQHGTEVGAASFWAYQSARSLTHLTGERHEKRLVRWQAIVKTAGEQSHRARLPAVRADGTLTDVLRAAPAFDLALLAHPVPPPTLREKLSSFFPLSVLVIIGPESGFSESEIAEARRVGVQSVSLGPRIFRTETAALVMLSQILYSLESP